MKLRKFKNFPNLMDPICEKFVPKTSHVEFVENKTKQNEEKDWIRSNTINFSSTMQDIN